jgi:type II secretory ATPase GspE/PulE/Tfp pilus assembly ATPase PilB-like protein
VQVNPKIDWTFAKALRAFLRADPDVIMVGEIRDHETAQVAVESSLTGHLVLSTLHTNSAPETVTRLLDMGMDPFNFGDSLLGVLSQRLVRRLCPSCRVARPATDEEVQEWVGEYLFAFGHATAPSADALLTQWLRRFGRLRDDPTQADLSGHGVLLHHHSPGCEKCSGTGFRGRVGVHELLTVDRGLRHLIQTRARVDDIQRAAVEAGMRTLRQDGIEKVLAGATTIGEVRATTNA